MPIRLKQTIPLPFHRVTHTPTTDDVLNMCERLSSVLPIGPEILKNIKGMLPCMLEGKPWNQANADNVRLPQYVGGGDTVAYVMDIKDLERKYDPTNKDGRWLYSSARWLICWVAEELKDCHGIGLGWSDVFSVSHLRIVRTRLDALREESLSPVPEDVNPPCRIFPSRQMEYDFLEFQMGDPPTPTRESPQLDVPTPSSFPTPPSQNAQRARTLGNNESLKDFLRNLGTAKRGRAGEGYLMYSDQTLYEKVKLYLRTEEGRHLLEACEIDPQAATIDHVMPESQGGPDHLFNYHLMPAKDNSSFNGVPHTNKHKMAYVGRDQVALLRHLLMEAKKRLPWYDIGYI